ncbi:MAG: hypothetical protein ACXAC7_13930, partial [Candidatus Hodarchaeales archaeon]
MPDHPPEKKVSTKRPKKSLNDAKKKHSTKTRKPKRHMKQDQGKDTQLYRAKILDYKISKGWGKIMLLDGPYKFSHVQFRKNCFNSEIQHYIYKDQEVKVIIDHNKDQIYVKNLEYTPKERDLGVSGRRQSDGQQSRRHRDGKGRYSNEPDRREGVTDKRRTSQRPPRKITKTGKPEKTRPIKSKQKPTKNLERILLKDQKEPDVEKPKIKTETKVKPIKKTKKKPQKDET